MALRYVLVCRGPHCEARESSDVREKLRQAVADATSTEGRNDVSVLPYTCFDRCGRGPNAAVYPDGIWYEALSIEDVDNVARYALGGPIPAQLVADVDERHARECYRLFDDLIPQLADEEARKRAPRHRSWPF